MKATRDLALLALLFLCLGCPDYEPGSKKNKWNILSNNKPNTSQTPEVVLTSNTISLDPKKPRTIIIHLNIDSKLIPLIPLEPIPTSNPGYGHFKTIIGAPSEASANAYMSLIKMNSTTSESRNLGFQHVVERFRVSFPAYPPTNVTWAQQDQDTSPLTPSHIKGPYIHCLKYSRLFQAFQIFINGIPIDYVNVFEWNAFPQGRESLITRLKNATDDEKRIGIVEDFMIALSTEGKLFPDTANEILNTFDTPPINLFQDAQLREHGIVANPRTSVVYTKTPKLKYELIISGDDTLPTPLVFSHLGLNKLITEEHKEAFTLDDLKPLFIFSIGKTDASKETVSSNTLWDRIYETPTLEDLKHLNILDIGSGTSGMIPYFQNRGVKNARGLDIWYGLDIPLPTGSHSHFLETYRQKHQPYLVQDDATKLESISDRQYDQIYSHMLFGNLKIQQQTAMLKQVIRISKPNSTIRIATDHDLIAKDESQEVFTRRLQSTIGKFMADNKWQATVTSFKSSLKRVRKRKFYLDAFSESEFMELLSRTDRSIDSHYRRIDYKVLLIVIKRFE